MRNAPLFKVETTYGQATDVSYGDAALFHPLVEHAASVEHLGGNHWRLCGVMGFRLAEHCAKVGLTPPNPLYHERSYTVELRGY